jgi:aldehyde dehydrogenase (NAD+)
MNPVEGDRTASLESGLIIGGRVVDRSEGGTMDHINPATGKAHMSFPVASVEEVSQAVCAARAAFDDWRSWQPDARRDVLMRLADLLVENAERLGVICTLESGSLYSEYNARYAADWFRYYAGWADKLSGESINPYPSRGLDYTVPEPIGVAGIIVTWNGPLGFCGMAGAPALAAGCTIVVKSPELAPFSPVTFARLCAQAGIPPGVVNVVTGGPEVGDALIRHEGVDKISFTGGTVTARKLQEVCALTLKPLVMELGGKSANIVFADAEIEEAIALAARFTGAAGQGCSLPTRLLVERTVYDRVVEGVVRRAEQVAVGDPFDPAITMGPVISEGAATRIVSMVDEAIREGSATLVTGGHRIGGDLADGFFVEPTVLAGVDPNSRIAREEIFGPVLTVIPFDTEGEAVEIANSTRYGLAAYVQTTDMSRAHRLVSRLQAGNVHINGSGPGPVSPASPFGGVKQSGYGRQGGRDGILEFVQTKNVYWNI